MDDTPNFLLFYFANLAFIATNLYGWILKEFYKAEPHKQDYDALFPAQRAVAILYLAQLFEIPYLLMIDQPKALFYVNAFSVLFFSSMLVVLCEVYFFRRKYATVELLLYFLPAAIPVLYLLLAVYDLVPSTAEIYRWLYGVVCTVSAYYIVRVIIVQRRVLRSMKNACLGKHPANDKFPIRFVQNAQWLLLPVCLPMFCCFLLNDEYVKMGRDLLFTVVNVWFLLYTIKPHREVTQAEVASSGKPKSNPTYRLSAERCVELEQQIIDLLEQESLFLDPNFTISKLSDRINSNKNYVSEGISRGRFESFYAMINHYRIEYAIALLRSDPNLRVEPVAIASGFSSASVFAQIFKRHTGMPAKQFIRRFPTK